jgi:hypothetical protein
VIIASAFDRVCGFCLRQGGFALDISAGMAVEAPLQERIANHAQANG